MQLLLHRTCSNSKQELLGDNSVFCFVITHARTHAHTHTHKFLTQNGLHSKGRPYFTVTMQLLGKGTSNVYFLWPDTLMFTLNWFIYICVF